MKHKKAVFIHSPQLEKYSYPPDCPFNITRAPRTRSTVASMGLLSPGIAKEVPPQPAERDELKKFHTARYLNALRNAQKGKIDIDAYHMGIGSPDCPVFEGMYDYSVLACGASLTAAKMIIQNEAFLAFNPSGGLHHAAPDHAAGFCYINDVALACQIFTEAKKRVLYLDIDVHHGDGVQNFFYDRNDVMTISLHENPATLFPGTGFEYEIGQGKGTGYSVNIPFPTGTYDQVYLHAFNEIVTPLISAFDPDVFVFELGTDALSGDPLAHLRLTNNVYVDIIKTLLDAEKPILMTGGGGYNVKNTVRAWSLAWSVLCGQDNHHDANLAIGGVMMETTDWLGGLRDRHLPIDNQQRETVIPIVRNTIKTIKEKVFPLHGLK